MRQGAKAESGLEIGSTANSCPGYFWPGQKEWQCVLSIPKDVHLQLLQRPGASMIVMRTPSTVCNATVACIVVFFILLGFSTRAVPGFRASRNDAFARTAYADDALNSTLGVCIYIRPLAATVSANRSNSSKRSSQSVFLPERITAMHFSWHQPQATSRSTGSME
jgi:hypothetical protein